jgi:hypothetical protein
VLQSPERLRALVAQLAAGAGLAAPDGIKEGLHLVQQQIVAAEQAQFEIAAALTLGAKVQEMRGLDGTKEAKVKIGDLEVGVAVASSLKNAARLLESIRAGRKEPGWVHCRRWAAAERRSECIKARMQALYQIDREETLRVSHKNEDVARLYKEFLGALRSHGGVRALLVDGEKRKESGRLEVVPVDLADLARSLDRLGHAGDTSHGPRPREIVHRLKIEPVLRRLAECAA